MKIVVDMDNTLADELGRDARPGVHGLLDRLVADGHELHLWTSSTRQRAQMILRYHGFEDYFASFHFREDYDPAGEGRPKDIREIDGDVLIDDDPDQIAYTDKSGRRGVLISAYRGGDSDETAELERVYAAATKKPGLLGRLFK